MSEHLTLTPLQQAAHAAFTTFLQGLRALREAAREADAAMNDLESERTVDACDSLCCEDALGDLIGKAEDWLYAAGIQPPVQMARAA